VRYAAAYRTNPPKAYDFRTDPRFKVRPFDVAQQFASHASVNVAVPETPEEFRVFVEGLISDFKWMVEDRGLLSGFWSGDRPYNERQAQDVFQMSVLQLCRLLDVDLTPEANAGRGPVDFKFSAGWSRRALVEVKFAKSSSYWENLENQTPAYLFAEDINFGVIVVIQHDDVHCEQEFVDRTDAIVAKVARETGLDYKAVFIDVRRRPPASQLRSG
jgi:hypothetical protein